jgi:hypothetical protein
MIIFQLFNELDQIIIHHFGELDDALHPARGKQIVEQLLSEANRAELLEWYKSRERPLNSLAMEIKQRLERELGEEL